MGGSLTDDGGFHLFTEMQQTLSNTWFCYLGIELCVDSRFNANHSGFHKIAF